MPTSQLVCSGERMLRSGTGTKNLAALSVELARVAHKRQARSLRQFRWETGASFTFGTPFAQAYVNPAWRRNLEPLQTKK